MRRLFLPLAFLISVIAIAFAPDPFGWVFNLGLTGVWCSLLAGGALGVRRLLRARGKVKRITGWILSAAAVSGMVIAAVGWGDYHRVVFRRAGTADWAADISDLRRSIDRLPPGLAARARTTMEPELADLEQSLPVLNDDQRHARLTRAIASLHDGHSMAFPFFPATSFALVPVRMRFFEDGLFIVDAARSHRDLIGSQVIRIAGLDVAQALAVMRPYVSADNESAVRDRSPYYMLSPRLWRAIGQPVEEDRLPLELKSGDRSRTVVLDTVSRWRYLWWILPSLGLREAPFSITLRPDAHAVYVPFRAVRADGSETLTAFGHRLIAAARASGAERIIIDVRQNSGGDNTLFKGLIKALAESEFNARGRLILLIGGGTFSAATNFVSAMERDTRVILIGEPTGSGPNHFGDPGMRKLERTGIVVFLSTRYHQFGAPDDRRLAHDPEIPVGTRSEDFFAGRDPVLEAALRYR